MTNRNLNGQVAWVTGGGTGIGLETVRALARAGSVVVVSGLKDAEFHTAVDCAIAAQNLVLAAESLGLSSCWIGLTHWYFQSEGARRDLEIPEGYEPHFAIALGYREGPAPEEPERRGHPVTVLR